MTKTKKKKHLSFLQQDQEVIFQGSERGLLVAEYLDIFQVHGVELGWSLSLRQLSDTLA